MLFSDGIFDGEVKEWEGQDHCIALQGGARTEKEKSEMVANCLKEKHRFWVLTPKAHVDEVTKAHGIQAHSFEDLKEHHPGAIYLVLDSLPIWPPRAKPRQRLVLASLVTAAKMQDQRFEDSPEQSFLLEDPCIYAPFPDSVRKEAKGCQPASVIQALALEGSFFRFTSPPSLSSSLLPFPSSTAPLSTSPPSSKSKHSLKRKQPPPPLSDEDGASSSAKRKKTKTPSFTQHELLTWCLTTTLDPNKWYGKADIVQRFSDYLGRKVVKSNPAFWRLISKVATVEKSRSRARISRRIPVSQKEESVPK